ncbi:MAG TPA: CpcT/CpeT family chromophore lyase [Steroidobacteraceae bacterium]|nr:CpcT/CpeT family chromophore lyase [Steroidobacteraceae bacterium]
MDNRAGARRGGAGTGALLVLLAAALAAGCASETKRHKADLAEVTEWLPGRYDNQAQVAADRRAGRAPHEALALSVLPVVAAEMGVQMFYLQETATDTREIKLQRLLSMGIIDGKIVGTLWSFTDPPRWREGETQPELFTSLQPQDVRALRGCNLTWKKAGTKEHEDEKFTASTELGKCNPSVSRSGVPDSTEIRAVLTPDELDVSTRPVDAQGRALSATEADPYIRFRRSGGP